MLLVDGLDTHLHGQMRVQDHISSVKYDLSTLIWLICSGQDLDQGGLARSVFPAEAMYFTFDQVERDVLQRQHPGKAFRNVSQLKDLGHGSLTWDVTRRSKF